MYLMESNNSTCVMIGVSLHTHRRTLVQTKNIQIYALLISDGTEKDGAVFPKTKYDSLLDTYMLPLHLSYAVIFFEHSFFSSEPY